MLRYRVAFAAVLFCSLIAPAARAGEAEMAVEISTLKARIARLEGIEMRVYQLEQQTTVQKKEFVEQVGNVQQVREALIRHEPGEGLEIEPGGLKIQAGATFVFQGTPNANNAGDEGSSMLDGSWSSDIFIEKAFGDWGLAFAHLEPGQNTGLESELSLFSNVNRDANSTDTLVSLTEVWYEQYMFNKALTVTTGKMDPANHLDQNELAHDETSQFLGRIFRNSPAIEWPDDNTLGACFNAVIPFFPCLEASCAYFNADNSWDQIFNKAFGCAQITVRPERFLGLPEAEWGGNYRFYGWINGLDHPKLVGQDDLPADKSKEENYGFGLSFDQMLNEAVGVFARFGWQRPDLAIVSTNSNTGPVEASWSTGLQVNGRLWARPDDAFAFAFGQAIPSKHYKDAGHGGASETHFEAYYRCRVTKCLALSPDLQVIWNPDGIGRSYQGDNTAMVVYGLRGQMDF